VLGRIGTEEATKALTEVAAHDTSSEVREEAVAALAEVIRRRNETAIEDSTG
jgi:HEAT repeat protein